MAKRSWKDKNDYRLLMAYGTSGLGTKFRNSAFLSVAGLGLMAWMSYDAANAEGTLSWLVLFPPVLILIIVSIISTPIAFYYGVKFARKTDESIKRTLTLLTLLIMISLILLIFYPKY